MAVGIALGKSPEYLDNVYRTVADNSQGKSPIYWASYYMEEVLRDMIDSEPLAYRILQGKCCFGTTAFFSKHRWHISWHSNEDLIESIKCSYHVPFYCKNINLLRGEIVLDGAYGFAGVDLVHDDDTLFVGIDPHAEITRLFTNAEMVRLT